MSDPQRLLAGFAQARSDADIALTALLKAYGGRADAEVNLKRSIRDVQILEKAYEAAERKLANVKKALKRARAEGAP